MLTYAIRRHLKKNKAAKTATKENTMVDYKELSKNYQDQLMATLKDFIPIKSFYDEATVSEEHPFGEGVSKGLKFIEELARKDGFKAVNYDNKVVEITYGDYEQNVTLLAHTDVVPAGESGWEQEPFELTESDGILRGRGVSDDKGPLLAAFYAMKLLKENNLFGKYQVRLLVGGNEETGHACVRHYFQTLKKKQPTLGFSPDADFPLIYAEKGIINYDVEADFKLEKVHTFNGGVAFNSVIDRFTVELDNDEKFIEYLKENKVEFTHEVKGDLMEVTFIGKTAHGSLPEEGINACIVGLDRIDKFYNISELHKIVELYTDPFGKGINAYNESEDMGKNSMNLGIAEYKDGHLKLVINFRHVNGPNPDTLIKQIEEANKPFKVTVTMRNPLLFYPLDSPLVSTLLNVYREETGDQKSKPLAIGGGTYAKDAENVVAFGITLPGEEPDMHGPKENIPKSTLFKGIHIYAHAIAALGKKIEEGL